MSLPHQTDRPADRSADRAGVNPGNSEGSPVLRPAVGDSSRNERFPALTGIRAIAAFMVFFNHLPLHLKPGFLMGLQAICYTGVCFFFVLSGFLIAWRYYEEVQLSGSWLLQYFTNRFARIYPVYFLVLTVVILLKKNFDPVFLLQNYTLTHNLFFLFTSHGIAIGPSWTLTVEECFYLLAPFIFILSRNYNLGLPFFLTLVLTIILFFTYYQGKPFNTGLFALLWDSFFGRFLEFFIGIYLALLMRRKEGVMPATRIGAAAPVATRATKKWTMIGIAGIVLLFLPLIYVTNKSDVLKWPVMIAVNNFMLPFPIAILYFGLISEASLPRWFLSSGGMRLAGRSSYAFYLLHLPVIDYLGTPYLQKYFGGGSYNLYVLLVFMMTLALSVILFLIYEEPLNRRIRKSFLYFSRRMA